MYGVMGGPRHEVIAKIQNTATANDFVGEQQALGEFVEIEYGPLGMVVDQLSLTMTDETLQPAPRLLYIVKIFRKINPSEFFTTTQYTYSGFKYDFARRASVGFAQRAAEVLPQKSKTITAFEQKHPFVGLPKWSQERTNGKLLTFVANSWETKKYQKNWQYATDKSLLIFDEDASSQDRDFLFQFEINSDVMPQMTLVGLPIEAVALRKLKNPDVDGISYFPYVAKSTTVTFFPEGDMRNTIVTNQEFDDFGNVLTVRRESEDGKTIKTANTYLLDLQHWVIGAMKSATTETTRGSEIIRRRVEFEIDAAGAISKEIIEPGKPDFRATEYTRDFAGNVTKKTRLTASGKRQFETVFDKLGRLPARTINEIGQQRSMTYTRHYGELSTLIDENGLREVFHRDNFDNLISSESDSRGVSTIERRLCDFSCPANGSVLEHLIQTGGVDEIRILGRQNQTVQRVQRTPKGKIQTYYSYDENGQVRSIEGPTYGTPKPVVWVERDAFGRISRSKLGNSIKQEVTYDNSLRTVKTPNGITQTRSIGKESQLQ